MSKYQVNELYTDKTPHLNLLITGTGTKSFYDAVSQCSRCGYCETSCPTYILEKRETLSPRGRNQIVRQLAEGKFKAGADGAMESLKTCLLCGACSDICYGKVATPDIVLEARRESTGYGKSFIYKTVIGLKKNKFLFDLTLKSLYLLKKTGLAWLSEKMGIFHFLGMPAMGKAHQKLLRTPLKFLSERLAKDPALNGEAEIKWVYFASCGTNYIFTEAGFATVRLLQEIYGNGLFMKNECCGLISYNYGALDEAKEAALKNIEIYEKLSEKHQDFKMIADCSSCAAFLKTYPQLFSGEEDLFKRACKFSENIKDITEFVKPEHLEKKIDIEKTKKIKVTIHDSCRACHGQGIFAEQRAVLSPVLGKNLVEMKESSMCCGGAGAFAFTNPELSDKILRRKIKNISETQADIVIASSTSCLIQIEAGLKEMYPSAKIMHYSEFLSSLMKNSG